MLRQGRSLLLVTLVILLGNWADSSSAGEGFFRRNWMNSTSQAPTDGGYGMSYGPPGPQRYPAYADGNAPWYGYGFGVPTYNWGYFGVHYRPMNLVHVGYYGDYYQWGYRRGY